MKWFVRPIRLLAVVGSMALALGLSSSAKATNLVLTDLNSTVQIESQSQAGMYQWIVDGTSHLFQQWFWFRIGDTAEASIDTLGQNSAVAVGNLATMNYGGAAQNADLDITVNYLLTGGTAGSGTSDVAETIRIINTSGTSLVVNFFQYSDFDLDGSSGGDTVTFTNPNAVRQVGDIVTVSETTITPTANRREANFYPNTLNELNDGVATNLDDANVGGSAPLGPGDVTWAYQWTINLAAGGTFIISKDKHLAAVVPEPGTLAMAALIAPVGIISVLRRRKKA
jgi:hypothetical protein